jgi:DNA-binding beta-propeller fold protein YncE
MEFLTSSRAGPAGLSPLVLFLLLAFLLVAPIGCSERDHLNPVDPENPDTGGVPWGFQAVAGNQEVTLDWTPFEFDDLAAFRIDRRTGAGADSAIARLLPDAGSFADTTAENSQDYRYRLVPLLAGDRPVAVSGTVAATPGPQLAWVADTGGFQVARLAPDGRVVVFRRSGFRAPNSVSVSALDGRAWVADSFHGRLVALDDTGTTTFEIGGFGIPKAVSVSPVDGSVWVADEEVGEVVHLEVKGAVLGRASGLTLPADVAANSADSSAWAADAGSGEVLRIGAQGQVLARTGGFSQPLQIAAVPADTSCWVADDDLNEVAHLAPDGSRLNTIAPIRQPFGLAVDPSSGDLWVGSFADGTVERYSSDGQLELTIGGFVGPLGIARDPVDGGVWVVDSGRDQVVKLDATGAEIARTGGYSTPYDIDVGIDVSMRPIISRLISQR